MSRRWLVILAAALCAGCGIKDTVSNFLIGGKDNAEPPAPLVNFVPKLNVVQLWSRDIGHGTDKQYLKLSPVQANQRLYIVDADGDLNALDATNGQTVWADDLDTHITGGPGYGENTVMVGTSNGKVITFAADTGKQLWETQVSSEILSPPAKSGGIVVVRTGDGKVYGLDGGTGKTIWIYDRTVPTLSLRGTSAPVIVGDKVVAGFDGGRLAALDLHTGRLLWETPITEPRGRSELERMVDIDGDPVVRDGIIYAGSFQGRLAAVQLETGQIVWARQVSTYSGFTADDSFLYLTDSSSQILAIDRFTGTTVWKHDKLHARAATGPASIGKYIAVGDYAGYLHWMDKQSGHFVARVQPSEKPIYVDPLVVGKLLYVYCSDGTLAAYTYR